MGAASGWGLGGSPAFFQSCDLIVQLVTHSQFYLGLGLGAYTNFNPIRLKL